MVITKSPWPVAGGRLSPTGAASDCGAPVPTPARDQPATACPSFAATAVQAMPSGQARVTTDVLEGEEPAAAPQPSATVTETCRTATFASAQAGTGAIATS